MNAPFIRRFLMDEPCLPGLTDTPVPVFVGILSDDGSRRVILERIGDRCAQQIHCHESTSWSSHDVVITDDQFLKLWQFIRFPGLRMERYHGQTEGIPFWLDDFKERLNGLRIATFHFPDSFAAYQWQPPSTIGPEITYDQRFETIHLIKSPPLPESLPVRADSQKKNLVIGVIPYFVIHGAVEIVTVKTRTQAHTIFPKGQPEPQLTAKEVARLEAIEEAGIEGEFRGHPLLLPFKEIAPQNWLLFPMEVTNILSEWKEKGIRNRMLVRLSDALHHPQYHRIEPALEFLMRAVVARIG